MARAAAEPIRRAQIVKATIQEVARAGSLEVTVAQIAARAGMSTALAHHYFGSKEAIFVAAMRHVLTLFGAEVRGALAVADTPGSRVEAIVRASFGPGSFRREAVSAWLNFYVLAQTMPEARRLLAVYHGRLRSNLVHGLRPLMGHRAGEVAEGLGALIDGVYLRQALSRGLPDRAGATALVLSHLAREVGVRPNILVLMVDQLAGTLFPDGPAPWLHAPNLARLAERSTRFAKAYTASPLCAPARASLMSGQLPSRTRVYDNAAEFASDIPTFAHHLRRVGYRTILSGKMHFVGPDQMHGLEERLTTDIYPADFGWTPDYRKPAERIDWWYHTLGSVPGAGVAEITNQYEYDDDVVHQASQKLYDLARGHDPRPWCLTVSLSHPHDPYVARRRYWDLYDGSAHLDPEVPQVPMDPHSLRIMEASDWRSHAITPEQARRARRAYFANISYVDAKVGELLAVLAATRQEAAVVFTSDHGDMLGERGMWFKMNMFEPSARVPLMIAAPGLAPGLVATPVSTLDLAPTLCDLAGVSMAEVAPWTDGTSLMGRGEGRGPVPMEYAAEASEAPIVALRDGRWKHVRCALDPDLLFDLDADPAELVNLATDPAHAETLARLRAVSAARWDLAAFDAQVRESQARRLVVYEALRRGAYFPWDYQPLQRAAERYMRNHMDLNVLEEAQRFPRGE